jgi:hypothetical protein
MRFATDYINDLIEGNLSVQGYNHILKVIAYYAKKNNWPVYIIGEKSNKRDWDFSEYEELSQQFFEWVFVKNKIRHISKVPNEYRSFYFLQLLVSFISEKISQVQRETGISFSNMKKQTLEVLNNHFTKIEYNNSTFWYNTHMIATPVSFDSIQDKIQYLPKTKVSSSTGRLKPQIRNLINLIFDVCEYPIQEDILMRIVFSLFDQSSFQDRQFESNDVVAESLDKSSIHALAIKRIVQNLSKDDSKLILSYIFSENPPSMDELAKKFDLAKSTVHFKISAFKKKIQENYQPENQEDGEKFVEKVYATLDKIASG